VMADSVFTEDHIQVNSPNVVYNKNEIISQYYYQNCVVDGGIITPTSERLTFKVGRVVPKIGIMLVGWGGNNGSTVTAGIFANKKGMSWQDKEGVHYANYFGSIVMSSTTKIGVDNKGCEVYCPLRNLLPMVHPNNIIVGGWDISSANLHESMVRAKVLDFDLQRKLKPYMERLVPLPSIYYPDFIAANQSGRANNLIPGTKQEQLETIRQNIRDFKACHNLDKVIVLWTANTERFTEVEDGLNDTAENLLDAIKRNESEVSPSTMFAVASILEGVSYINGSPQNTFVPGCVELAERHQVFIAGDDFKSGQTKMKSVLVDFLISAGIKPASICSYNHLGNNDGYNLSAPQTFRSKEISKSNVVDDMVASNKILYEEEEHPDHQVVIKYVPYVGDSKRAMDEYISEIFMGGKNTIVMHNTCEDSLLAAPLIYDLVVLCELCERIEVKRDGGKFERFHPVLSILNYMLKAPMVPHGSPAINALFSQKQCLVNIFRACIGMPPENFMLLEHKISSLIQERQKVLPDTPTPCTSEEERSPKRLCLGDDL